VPIPQALADMQGLVDDGVLLDDATILAAMRLIHRHAGLVVEPSGAVGVAALLERPERYRGRLVGTILCGGNLTEAQVRDWL
jgi:threonine dehydratase